MKLISFLLFVMLLGCYSCTLFYPYPYIVMPQHGYVALPQHGPVSDINSCTEVSGGMAHTCALLSSGKVKCWGHNDGGQLGNGTTANSTIPVEVEKISDVLGISAGGGHTCALLSSAVVMCWGNNESGQLGNGSTSNSSVPVQVKRLSGVSAISAGLSHTCAALLDGTVECWGNNEERQLGSEGINSISSSIPVRVNGISDGKLITSGVAHTCVLLGDGSISCWGTDSYGYPSSVAFSLRSSSPLTVTNITNAISIAAGRNHTCALLSDKTVQCWGSNILKQLGNDLGSASAIPLAVQQLFNVKAISAGLFHTCSLSYDKTVKCWGSNPAGVLGVSESKIFNTSVPRLITGLPSVLAIEAGGTHNCVVLDDGTVRCWGANENSQLGR